MNDEKPLEIYVTPVKYVKTAWFIDKLVHFICIMNRPGCDMNEDRDGSSDIILGM
jgi:hypothetical protein